MQEQRDQMLNSTLVIMIKSLKTIKMTDTQGEWRPCQRYLFAVACIVAANQSDSNISGKPLFIKSIQKAAFIAYNIAELLNK